MDLGNAVLRVVVRAFRWVPPEAEATYSADGVYLKLKARDASVVAYVAKT